MNIAYFCKFYLAFVCILVSATSGASGVYICTTADQQYFHCLINLIGSLHKHNFEDIEQIAVFDLGLTQLQINQLRAIDKIEIYDFELTHPDLLKRFNTRTWGKPVPGWYAWKPVAIKQAFDLFPDDAVIFWIDSGTTILGDMKPLFLYIKEHGYFFHNGCDWFINRESTKFVQEAFQLNSPERSWILQDGTVGMEAGFMGVTKKVYYNFLLPMYELTKDLRFYADDGSCPNGFGESRHDQTLFSIYALLNNYHIFHHFQNPKELIYLDINGQNHPFHIACIPEALTGETIIYRARFDVKPQDYVPYIKLKQ